MRLKRKRKHMQFFEKTKHPDKGSGDRPTPWLPNIFVKHKGHNFGFCFNEGLSNPRIWKSHNIIWHTEDFKL